MVFVLGDRGYIGSNLVPYLESKGHEVERVKRRQEFNIKSGVIINCAGYVVTPDKRNIARMVQDNTVNPILLCNTMEFFERDVKLIHLSSSSEIFQPHTAYARTKSLASDHLRGKATLCYIYTAWGGINQHPHTFMAALLKAKLKAKREGTTMHLTTPYATRDFVHIKHICRGIEELITKPIGEYHFGMGKARMMEEVVRMAGVPFTFDRTYDEIFSWKAKEPYFADTFQKDLEEELCRP